MLILVIGLPGSGKSAVASRLARRLEASWISSDVVRTDAGLRGRYSREDITEVYRRMMTQARQELAAGGSVVLDGSFSSRTYRDWALAVAAEAGAETSLIHMVANEATCLRRVARKRKLTEAGPEAYRLLKSQFDPIEGEYLTLDSSTATLKRLLARAHRYLERKRKPDSTVGG